jgi:hypothetical protein
LLPPGPSPRSGFHGVSATAPPFCSHCFWPWSTEVCSQHSSWTFFLKGKSPVRNPTVASRLAQCSTRSPGPLTSSPPGPTPHQQASPYWLTLTPPSCICPNDLLESHSPKVHLTSCLKFQPPCPPNPSSCSKFSHNTCHLLTRH